MHMFNIHFNAHISGGSDVEGAERDPDLLKRRKSAPTPEGTASQLID